MSIEVPGSLIYLQKTHVNSPFRNPDDSVKIVFHVSRHTVK